MIGRICTRTVYFASPDETVDEAAQRMRQEDVGTLVVVDDDRKPIGLLTDRDVVVRCVADDRDPKRTYIEDVMSAPVVSAPEATPIEDALARMATSARRRIVVTDAEGRLAGILSLDDVLELLAEEGGTIGRLLRQLQPDREPRYASE
jgi:CBS domain-containing protein